MARAKRVRWECPNGLHAGVLGSSRPRKNATARYCLPCSEVEGVLVERVAPALERKRAARTTARDAKARAQRDAAREARAAALLVTVLDAAGEPFVVDAGALLREAWYSRELRQAREDHSRFARHPLPELVIRRGSERSVRAHLSRERAGNTSAPIRARDTVSGHAKTYGGQIVLTVAPGCGHEWLRAVIVHEAAHMSCPDASHGGPWRRAYVRAVRELYGPLVRNEGAAWRMDEAVAQAILDTRER